MILIFFGYFNGFFSIDNSSRVCFALDGDLKRAGEEV